MACTSDGLIGTRQPARFGYAEARYSIIQRNVSRSSTESSAPMQASSRALLPSSTLTSFSRTNAGLTRTCSAQPEISRARANTSFSVWALPEHTLNVRPIAALAANSRR